MLLKRIAIAAVASVVACGAPVNDERVASNISLTASEQGGTYTGAFSAGSGLPQLMSVATGDLSGSSLLIPPGALSVDLSISVSTSTSLATAAQIADLGLSGVTLSSAGPAVHFAPSSDVELSQPMLISIPMAAGSLWLGDDDENLVVVYKAIGVKDGVTETVSGLIPRSELVVSGSVVKFKTARFGAFQAVKSSARIEGSIAKPSSDKIGESPGLDLVGVWWGCRVSEGTPYSSFESQQVTVTSVGSFEYDSIMGEGYSTGETFLCPASHSSAFTDARFAGRFQIIAKSEVLSLAKDVSLPADMVSGNPRNVDLTVQTIYYTPNSQQANALNAAQACGISTWASKVSQSIGKMVCVTDILSPDVEDGDDFAVGDVIRGLYVVANDAAGKATLFIEGDNSSERPQAFGTDGFGLRKVAR